MDNDRRTYYLVVCPSGHDLFFQCFYINVRFLYESTEDVSAPSADNRAGMCKYFQVFRYSFQDLVGFISSEDIIDELEVIYVRDLHIVSFIGICFKELFNLLQESNTVGKSCKLVVCSKISSLFIKLDLGRIIVNREE